MWLSLCLCFWSCSHPAGAISISITFFNKAVLSVYKFNFGNTLMLAQMIASLIFMHFMKKYGLIKYKDFDSKVAKQVCCTTFAPLFLFSFIHNSFLPRFLQCVPLAGFFIAMVVLSLVALPFVNIPVYNTLRRFSTLLVIIIEFLFVTFVFS